MYVKTVIVFVLSTGVNRAGHVYCEVVDKIMVFSNVQHVSVRRDETLPRMFSHLRHSLVTLLLCTCSRDG